jgi:riboflavin synthase alpha subunit
MYQLISVASLTVSAQEYNNFIVDMVEHTAAVVFLKFSS